MGGLYSVAILGKGLGFGVWGLGGFAPGHEP